MTHLAADAEATEAVAARFAARVMAGDVVALQGELGAGKTTFTRGLVRGLGGDERRVSSPTYTLLQIYPTPRGDVLHVDAYRAVPEELEELLAEVYCTVIEWPERTELTPHWQVSIFHAASGRHITIKRVATSPPAP